MLRDWLMTIPSVILRPLEIQDADAFAQAVNASLESLQPWMVWAHPDYQVQEAINWITFTHMQRQRGAAEEFAIVDGHHRLLGGAGIRFAERDDACCALGYWVRSDAQRQGVATRVVTQLVKLGFTRPEVASIEILAAADNIASRALAERCQFAFVGYQYGLIKLASGPVNTAIYHLRRT